jgi:CTP:molybdopterin cytidylyltransferase MocA
LSSLARDGQPLLLVDVESARILDDLDTPADLERLIRLLS